MRVSRPAIGYLVTSSKAGLESFELMRLSRVANLRKELREVVKDWVESEVEARIARFILEERRAQDGDRVAAASRSALPQSTGCFPLYGLLPAGDLELFSAPTQEEQPASSRWGRARPLLPPAVPSRAPGVQMKLFAEPLPRKQASHLLPSPARLPAANVIRLKLPRPADRGAIPARSEAERAHAAISPAQAARSLALAALEHKPPEIRQSEPFATLLRGPQCRPVMTTSVPVRAVRRARLIGDSSRAHESDRVIPPRFDATQDSWPPCIARTPLACVPRRGVPLRSESFSGGLAAFASPSQGLVLPSRVRISIVLAGPQWFVGRPVLVVPRVARMRSEAWWWLPCSLAEVISREPLNAAASRLAPCSPNCEIAVPRLEDRAIFIAPPARSRVISASSRVRSQCGRKSYASPRFGFAVVRRIWRRDIANTRCSETWPRIECASHARLLAANRPGPRARQFELFAEGSKTPAPPSSRPVPCPVPCNRQFTVIVERRRMTNEIAPAQAPPEIDIENRFSLRIRTSVTRWQIVSAPTRRPLQSRLHCRREIHVEANPTARVSSALI